MSSAGSLPTSCARIGATLHDLLVHQSAVPVGASLLAEGVVARALPQGDILGFAPPFCLNREEADRIVAALARVVGGMALYLRPVTRPGAVPRDGIRKARPGR